MSTSPASDIRSPVTGTSRDAADSNIQPFFVLHKASSSPALESKSERSKKKSKKTGLSSPIRLIENVDDPPRRCSRVLDNGQLAAFENTWSKIENTINEVLSKIDLNLFKEVCTLVQDVLFAIPSINSMASANTQRPHSFDAMCIRIPTALIFTRNVEFVDYLLTFQNLGKYLSSNNCHVANLSGNDFSIKHGVGLCIRSLLKTLVPEASDAADIEVLLSWYMDIKNHGKPVVVIIDNVEHCCGEVLSELISILSECIKSLPVILIMGISTTVNTLRRLLPYGILQHLHYYEFMLVSPYERINQLIEDVFVKLCSGFTIGHQVALFSRHYFLRYDGTITSFVRALKLACIEHFLQEPRAVWSQRTFNEIPEGETMKPCITEHAALILIKSSDNDLAQQLLQLKRLWKTWSSIVMCLFEAGKLGNIELINLFCEAVDPSSLTEMVSSSSPPFGDSPNMAQFCPIKGGFISQAIHMIRGLPQESLLRLLESWKSCTQGITEIHGEVVNLLSLVGSKGGGKGTKVKKRENSTSDVSSCSKDPSALSDKAALLMEDMIRYHLMPIECLSCHEVICFKNADVLRSALLGDARIKVHDDLLSSQTYLQCCCCSRGKDILPSFNDTSILYRLAQEYGDLINIHDWYQSFEATVLNQNSKKKRKMQNSPSPKKAKTTMPTQSKTTIQARFCFSVMELQIVGLLQMPNKRRPDFVHRITIGP